MTSPTLERAARAAYEAYEASWEGDELKCWDAVARAVLMAVLPELPRVHTDGYKWREGHNGPFVLWEEIDAILNDGEGE